jgi:hypothetical protein
MQQLNLLIRGAAKNEDESKSNVSGGGVLNAKNHIHHRKEGTFSRNILNSRDVRR